MCKRPDTQTDRLEQLLCGGFNKLQILCQFFISQTLEQVTLTLCPLPKIALRVYREKYNQINILCHQHLNTYIQSYLLLLETVFQILREIVTGREESQKIFYRDVYKATNKKRALN